MYLDKSAQDAISAGPGSTTSVQGDETYVRGALRKSQKEKTEFHRRAIEKLNARCSKLQKRIDLIYVDKLDGEVEETSYRENDSQ